MDTRSLNRVVLCSLMLPALITGCRPRVDPGQARIGEPAGEVIRKYGKPSQWLINRVDGPALAHLDPASLPESAFLKAQPTGELWTWKYPGGVILTIREGKVDDVQPHDSSNAETGSSR